MAEGEKIQSCEHCGDIRRRNLRTLFLALIPPVAIGIADVYKRQRINREKRLHGAKN